MLRFLVVPLIAIAMVGCASANNSGGAQQIKELQATIAALQREQLTTPAPPVLVTPSPTPVRTLPPTLAPTAPPPTPSPTQPPTPLATPGPLLTASGSGNDDTPDFTVATPTLRVCAQVSGRSPGGSEGPDITAFIEREDKKPGAGDADMSQGGCKTFHTSSGPGQYYLHVIATSWTNWTFTVDAQ